MTYTYDLTTTIGKTRMLVKDTDISDNGDNAVWGDEELQAFLDMTGTPPTYSSATPPMLITAGNPNLRLAAALVCESEAMDAARAAKRIKLGNLGLDKDTVFEALKEQAADFRRTALGRISVTDSRTDFRLATETSHGNMRRW